MFAPVHLLFLALALTSPSLFAAANGGQELTGTWTGIGKQSNGSTWSMKFTVDGRGYRMDYPSLNCGGELQSLSRASGRWEFIEMLTYGKQRCADRGTVIIELVESRAAKFSYKNSRSNLVSASGDLTLMAAGTDAEVRRDATGVNTLAQGKLSKEGAQEAKTLASAVTSTNKSNSEAGSQAPDPTKNSGAAKGFKFEEPSGRRYTERLDPKVGVIVVDNERRLEWTKCFAGMESNGVGEPCTGKPQLLSHTRAVEFAEKLGWSLPPTAEYRLYEKNNYGDQIRLLLRDNGNRVWSSTGVSDTPNRKFAFIRVERSGGAYGSTSYTEETYHIDEQLPVMLVRRMRR